MILQQLYNSEINASVSTFWDGGFEVKLGDESNGFVAETNVDSWHEAIMWLTFKACEHYPDSDFAKETPPPMRQFCATWWANESVKRFRRMGGTGARV